MGQARARSGGWTGLLGSVFSRALRDLLGPTLAWGLGLVLYSVLIIASTNELLEPMRNLMKGPLGLLLGPMNTTMGLLQATVLTFTTFLLAGFGLTQVAAWADDEESGRLETVLGTPHARSAVVLARFAALLIALLGMVSALGAALWAGGQVFKVEIDPDKLWAGMIGLVPLALLVVTAGWAIGAALPRPGRVVPILGAVLVAMYFLDVLAPLLQLSPTVQALSIFYHYGKPFVEGFESGGTARLAAGALIGLGATLWWFGRRDIAK
jgi:putative exporter of polyketide antibiotics